MVADGRTADGIVTGGRELVGMAPASCPTVMPPGFDLLVIAPDRSLFLRPPTDLAADMRQE